MTRWSGLKEVSGRLLTTRNSGVRRILYSCRNVFAGLMWRARNPGIKMAPRVVALSKAAAARYADGSYGEVFSSCAFSVWQRTNEANTPMPAPLATRVNPRLVISRRTFEALAPNAVPVRASAMNVDILHPWMQAVYMLLDRMVYPSRCHFQPSLDQLPDFQDLLPRVLFFAVSWMRAHRDCRGKPRAAIRRSGTGRSRPAPRLSQPPAQSVVRDPRAAFTGARHWGEHGGVHAGQRDSAEDLAGSRPAPHCGTATGVSQRR
jgi:hypothetical protein